MLKGKSTDFKALILLRIVKRLIENTESYGIYKLENILNKKVKIALPREVSKEERELKKEKIIVNQKEQIKNSVKNKIRMMPLIRINEGNSWQADQVEHKNNISKKPLIRSPTVNNNKQRQKNSFGFNSPQRKKIDDRDMLPAHLRYLKPTPILKKNGMDLGKLNPYLSDPNIDSIEVEGENEKVYVVGKMGKKPISIVFSREEIDEIIDKFSKEAKIPKVDGLFKVSINNLILTAMVSNVISSRFIIKKIRV